MNIIEQSIIGKKGPDRCEDAFVVTDDFVCVIDGSTSKSKLPPLPDGLTGGKMASGIVSEIVTSMPADITLLGFIQMVNELYQKRYREFYDEDTLIQIREHKENRWTCSAILYSRHENSIWMIGDCMGLLVNADGSTTELSNDKPYEAVLASKRAEYLREQLAHGNITIEDVRRHDSGRDQIIPEMLVEMRNQNVTYSVIDGFDIAWNNVKVIKDIEATEIVLASDGYPKLFPLLEETEAYLQECLAEDPLMLYLHPATKCWMEGSDSFDDRTYIRFSR